MPPKAKGKRLGEGNDGLAASHIQRPATPNDFQIVATVRTLQGLVNVESKWKGRVAEAQHRQGINATKMRKLVSMVEQSKEGIQQLNSEVDDIIQAIVVGDPCNPLGPLGHAGPTQPQGGKAKSKSIAPTDANPLSSDHLPPAVAAHRKEQAEALGVLLKAYYNLPRLAREERMAKPVVTSPVEMQQEMEEAIRLSTPTMELLQQAQERAQQQSQQTPNNKTAAAAAKKTPGKGHKGSVSAVPEVSVAEPIGDLNPSDFLPLPTPKGNLFEREMIPLQERSQGVTDMLSLSNYSLHAVQPRIQSVVEEEAALQAVRKQEDDAWLSKRTASTPQPGASRR